jgi:hypothetical protein
MNRIALRRVISASPPRHRESRPGPSPIRRPGQTRPLSRLRSGVLHALGSDQLPSYHFWTHLGFRHCPESVSRESPTHASLQLARGDEKLRCAGDQMQCSDVCRAHVARRTPQWVVPNGVAARVERVGSRHDGAGAVPGWCRGVFITSCFCLEGESDCLDGGWRIEMGMWMGALPPPHFEFAGMDGSGVKWRRTRRYQ